jgi:hypothetical protein
MIMQGEELQEETRGKLQELLKRVAVHYAKKSSKKKVAETQKPDVLVKQIMRILSETRGPITFTIPFNQVSIGEHKGKHEGWLDGATRIALENIAKFCMEIKKITGRKVVFYLLYDPSITIGIYGENEDGIVNEKEYFERMKIIHEYIQSLNEYMGNEVQIREWDVVGDGFARRRQKSCFLSKDEIEEEFSAKVNVVKWYFKNPEQFERKLCEIRLRNTIPRPDPSITAKWLKTVYPKKLANVSEDVVYTMALAFNERVEMSRILSDGELSPEFYIRLSPHEKSISEQTKYGFALFPGTFVMFEPWSADFNLSRAIESGKIELVREKSEEENIENIRGKIIEKMQILEEKLKIETELEHKIKELAKLRTMDTKTEQIHISEGSGEDSPSPTEIKRKISDILTKINKLRTRVKKIEEQLKRQRCLWEGEEAYGVLSKLVTIKDPKEFLSNLYKAYIDMSLRGQPIEYLETTGRTV